MIIARGSNLAFLRQEENQYLACPPHVARTLPDNIRQLIGYSLPSPSLGYVGECDHPDVTMRDGWDITVPGAHGKKLELEHRVEAWNRWDVQSETNALGLRTLTMGNGAKLYPKSHIQNRRCGWSLAHTCHKNGCIVWRSKPGTPVAWMGK